LVVADPPPDDDGDVWSETGKGRSQSNNYPTMTLAEIKTKYPLLPLAPNALVYIWTTSGYLDKAIASLKFWLRRWRLPHLRQSASDQRAVAHHAG